MSGMQDHPMRATSFAGEAPSDRSPDALLAMAIERAAAALRADMRPDGHWSYPLEADATIPAEYVLLRRYLGETPEPELERKIAAYLKRRQTANGGWPLFFGGQDDVSATVKAYFALKAMGEHPDSDPMRRARKAVLDKGGAERVNVFTRILLALFGIVPWSATPRMPVEIMLLPRWSPFHISKISYWARTVLVPLLVVQTLRPQSRSIPIALDELFVGSPSDIGAIGRAPHQSRSCFAFFAGVDKALGSLERVSPRRLRAAALARAVAFVEERLNGEDGLGAIFPAMANAVLMFEALGRGPDDPQRRTARAALDRLLMVSEDEAYCQPCVSPVWDTALACHALLDCGGPQNIAAARAGLAWLLPRQELDVRGDWCVTRAQVRPGGWAFQYANPHYPDLDDTAVIAMAMCRVRTSELDIYDEAIARSREWIAGLQSRDGGWAAFDADNTYLYLNNIPFSDHGALLDPPSPDLTGRCVAALSTVADRRDAMRVAHGLDNLRRTQRADGSWFGRWGVNYIYGTWSALAAFAAVGVDRNAPEIRRAAAWLMRIQNADGGWGESCESYALDADGHRPAPSTPSQSAWALLGLMAAGAAGDPVERGIDYLLARQDANGSWSEQAYTGTGFPRVFYLRYHGYPHYFPLMALARYWNARCSLPTPAAP
ncbi:MAG: squalene--hopene cyclase [Hyphomicrobiales bacterium]|nr:squalene--hopene cyclase [Hyphomicrobiales bacterium]